MANQEPITDAVFALAIDVESVEERAVLSGRACEKDKQLEPRWSDSFVLTPSLIARACSSYTDDLEEQLFQQSDCEDFIVPQAEKGHSSCYICVIQYW